MAFQADAFQDNQFGFQVEAAIVGAGLPVCDPEAILVGERALVGQIYPSGDSVLVGAAALASQVLSSGDLVLVHGEGTAKQICT